LGGEKSENVGELGAWISMPGRRQECSRASSSAPHKRPSNAVFSVFADLHRLVPRQLLAFLFFYFIFCMHCVCLFFAQFVIYAAISCWQQFRVAQPIWKGGED